MDIDYCSQCVYTLASVGSSVTLQDLSGCTALHFAAAADLEGRCVEYLLKRKADLNVLDKQGYSVLHYAAAGEKFLIILLMIIIT